MLEWKRFKAVRRLMWSAIVLTIFPGAFFISLSSLVSGWDPEALVILFPALLMASIALALHSFRPERLPATTHWTPERELITPLPRPVEAKWSTPRLTLPLLLWLFPTFFLALVTLGVRELNWPVLALIATPATIASLWGAWKTARGDQRLLAHGAVARGKIRRILRGQGLFRLKVEYEYEGASFFAWSDNLSSKTWFGPLFVEERRFITLLVDRNDPSSFAVYAFSDHGVANSPPPQRKVG